MSENENNNDIPDGQMENGYLPIEYQEFSDHEPTDQIPTSQDQFDVTLPTWHRYLGKLENVAGCTLYDENEIVSMVAIQTSTLVLPGFTLPLVITNDLEIYTLQRQTAKNNCFVLLTPNDNFYGIFSYGVIMEIYENHLRNDVLYLKAKSRQRCKLVPGKEIRNLIGEIYYVTVKVLLDYQLPSPIYNTQLLSLKKYRNFFIDENNNFGVKNLKKFRRWHLAQYPLATWIYDKHELYYSMNKLITELENFYNKELLPQNPKDLSYWFVQNFLLKHTERLRLLTINTTIERIRVELNLLNNKRCICCINCQTEIAYHNDVFAMSKDGVQSNYCNPGGHVFETLTVTKVRNIILHGNSSNQFSWFPGYNWTIILCKQCNAHLGWLFQSINLKPNQFYGLTKNALDIKIINNNDNNEDSWFVPIELTTPSTIYDENDNS